MTLGLVVLFVISGWALLSIVIAVTIGGIARERDAYAMPAPAMHNDQRLAS